MNTFFLQIFFLKLFLYSNRNNFSVQQRNTNLKCSAASDYATVPSTASGSDITTSSANYYDR